MFVVGLAYAYFEVYSRRFNYNNYDTLSRTEFCVIQFAQTRSVKKMSHKNQKESPKQKLHFI